MEENPELDEIDERLGDLGSMTNAEHERLWRWPMMVVWVVLWSVAIMAVAFLIYKAWDFYDRFPHGWD